MGGWSFSKNLYGVGHVNNHSSLLRGGMEAAHQANVRPEGVYGWLRMR